MSSSDTNGTSRGRIVVGLDSTRLDGKDLESQVAVWTTDTEEEFLNRVRSRARDQAKAIIIQALEEAERIKKKAVEDSRRECEQQVKARIEAVHHEYEDRFSRALQSLQSARQEVLAEHREDLLVLVRMAVEKAVRIELDQRGLDCLERLLEEALELVDSHRQLSLTVAPGMEEHLEELLKEARTRNPDLEKWKIKTSPDLEPGGVLVESSFGVVDNSVSGRLESIRCILEKLSLGEERE